jgi:hypothetical protein
MTGVLREGEKIAGEGAFFGKACLRSKQQRRLRGFVEQRGIDVFGRSEG